MATPVPGQSVDLGVYDRFHVGSSEERLSREALSIVSIVVPCSGLPYRILHIKLVKQNKEL